MDVFEKEEPATPIPISLTSSPVPAPATPTPLPELPVEGAKPADAGVSAETKQEVESALPEAGATEEVKESSHVSPPEVLVTESSPVAERTPKTTAGESGHAAVPTTVEQTQGSSAGS